MKNKILIQSLFVVLALSLSACSARKIIVSANPNLDPLPLEKTSTGQTGDPKLSSLWNMTKVAADQVWMLNSQPGAKRTLVALVGTGVDYTHEDLAEHIYVNQKESKATAGADDDQNGYTDDLVGYDFVENDGLPFDRNGMGTAVAGVVGAVENNGVGIRGIMSQVSLMPVRFIDGSGQFMFPHLIQSLEYALKANADVISLHMPSYVFGGGRSDASPEVIAIEKDSLTQILNQIKVKDIPVIVSAGNMGSSTNSANSLMEVFLKYSNVFVITSVDESDKRPFIANFGLSRVHTTAPGVAILTTQPNNRYEVMSGTALAAAHVTGAVALAVTQNFGRLKTSKILQSLLDPKASDAVSGLQFEVMGGNRLNVKKYLDYLDKQ